MDGFFHGKSYEHGGFGGYPHVWKPPYSFYMLLHQLFPEHRQKPSDQTVLQALERSCFGAQGFAGHFPPGGVPVDLVRDF